MKKTLLFLLATMSILFSSCEQTSTPEPPTISDQSFSIIENSANGTEVGTVIADENVNFSITAGNTDEAFKINATTGLISINNTNSIDYESIPSFVLSIEVTDNENNQTNSASITIQLIDEEIRTEDMVGMYLFDGNYEDSSSSEYHGINMFTNLANSDRLSNNTQVADFKGSNYIKLPTDFDYTNRTVSVWFNASEITNSTSHRIFYSDHPNIIYGSSNIDVYKDATDNKKYLRMEYGGPAAEDLKIEIEENRWYHAVLVIGEKSVRAYLDGKLYGESFSEPAHSNAGYPYAHIGCDRGENRYFFKGQIDNLIIYNQILYDHDIMILYKES